MSRPYSVHRPSKNRGDAIRLFCMECMGASVDPGFENLPYKAVKECPSEQACSLWPYRFGTDPKIKRKVSENSMKALAAYGAERSRTRQMAGTGTGGR